MEQDHIEEYINGEIDESTRNLISYFAVLWNLYENRLFNKEYSFNKVREYAIHQILENESKEETLLLLYNRLRNYFEARHYEYELETIRKQFSIRIKGEDKR